MMNNTINQQDVSSVDSLKFLKKRLTNYLTIGGIVLGSSLGMMNTAYSADVAVANGATVAAANKNGDGTTGECTVTVMYIQNNSVQDAADL